MKRKLVKQGAATMMVSLPSEWIKRLKLKKGDEVDIVEAGNNLAISGKKGKEASVKEISIPTPSEFMNRLIDIPYQQGYDELVIKFDDAKVMDLIVPATEKLLGFEVVSQTETSCTLKHVAEALEKEFEPMQRRIFLLIQSMANDSLKAAQDKEWEKLGNIADLERMCHKYCLFCMRLLNKYGYPDEKNFMIAYLNIATLEQVADLFSYLCKYMLENRRPLVPSTMKFYKEVVKMYNDYYTQFYKSDLKKLSAMKSKFNSMMKEGRKLIDRKKDPAVLSFLLQINENIRHSSFLLT